MGPGISRYGEYWKPLAWSSGAGHFQCRMSLKLTAKQETFCQHFAQFRDGAAAYRLAFDCSPEMKSSSVHSAASRLLASEKISSRVDELIAEITGQCEAVFNARRALEVWTDIATADPNELIGLKIGACRRCWGVGFGYQWKEHEYLEALAAAERAHAAGDAQAQLPDPSGGFGYRRTREPNPECPHCEGEGVERIVARDTSKLSPGAQLLYGGVKQTRNGPEVIIADRTKAWENASRIVGAFKDTVKLDGSLSAAIAVVKAETTDPNEASRLYQEMIRTKVAAN